MCDATTSESNMFIIMTNIHSSQNTNLSGQWGESRGRRGRRLCGWLMFLHFGRRLSSGSGSKRWLDWGWLWVEEEGKGRQINQDSIKLTTSFLTIWNLNIKQIQ